MYQWLQILFLKHFATEGVLFLQAFLATWVSTRFYLPIEDEKEATVFHFGRHMYVCVLLFCRCCWFVCLLVRAYLKI